MPGSPFFLQFIGNSGTFSRLPEFPPVECLAVALEACRSAPGELDGDKPPVPQN
jgi:hypothetical protein